MPNFFTRGCDHRERLCELSAVNAAVDDFVNKIIRVVMKALYNRPLARSRIAFLGLPKSRPGALPLYTWRKCLMQLSAALLLLIHDSLHSQCRVSRVISSLILKVGMGKWSRRS